MRATGLPADCGSPESGRRRAVGRISAPKCRARNGSRRNRANQRTGTQPTFAVARSLMDSATASATASAPAASAAASLSACS